jgi:hypothetical protein
MRLLFAVVLGLIIFRLGWAMARNLSRPLPPPPPPGEMRRINLRYRCGLCGAELKMVLATDDVPEPPRHCMEDMDLITPLE